MGSIDEYSDAAPQGKSMRVNGITKKKLRCPIHNFQFKNCVNTTLIVDASLKSFYSSLGFKVIKDFANFPNFEEVCKRFHYESGKFNADQKKTIGLQCLQTIPRRVTFLHDNQINLNIHKNVFRNLHDVITSENWFSNKYIEAEIKKKLDKIKGQLASD